MKEYTLSIVVPVYNVEDYLRECLNSITVQLTDQIRDDIEVILVDDGATDSSGSICDEIAGNDSCFRVIHKTNGGLSDARNVGIKAAEGKYILFLDSDDLLTDNCLKSIVEMLREESSDILMGRSIIFSDADSSDRRYNIETYEKYKDIKDPGEVYTGLWKERGFWFAAWLVIIKRQFLLENELFFEKGLLHEDARWVPLVYANADSVRLFDDVFYMYRKDRKGSIATVPVIKRQFDKIKTVEFFYGYKCKKADRQNLIRKEAAAILLGVILAAEQYKEHAEYQALLDKCKADLRMLNYGKYRIVAMICKVLGVEKAPGLIKRMM